MAKKSRNSSFLIILCVILIIGIILLVIEEQRKDRKISYLTYKINELKKGVTDVHKSEIMDKVKKTIEENLNEIVDKKPSSGCKWFLDEVKFIKNDIVKIQYEDGHTLNSITFKITNPDDYKTWVKVDNLDEER
jgi:preprotein translocase subunit YajC